MASLRRFEGCRFIGVRDTMTVYDTQDTAQLSDLQHQVEARQLFEHNQLQAFAPDDAAEARNRGFRTRS